MRRLFPIMLGTSLLFFGQGSCDSEDLDGDGWTAAEGDCNDTDAQVHPGAEELCDGTDNDCNDAIDDGADCAPCAVEFNGNLPYLFCLENLSWTDAELSCQARGYELASILDGDESAFALDAAEANEPGAYWWIGLNDIAVEGSYEWSDGNAVSYTNWISGEPNNTHGGECSSETEEDCTVFNWGGAGQWNDLPCSCGSWPTGSLNYICKLE